MIRSLFGHNRVNIPIAFILTIACQGRAFILPSYHMGEATTKVVRTKDRGFIEKPRSGREYSPCYDPVFMRLSTEFKQFKFYKEERYFRPINQINEFDLYLKRF
jgi:hypothetical protein